MAVDPSDPRVQRALYWARERRRKRYVRLGLSGPPLISVVPGDGSVGSALDTAGIASSSSVTIVGSLQHEGNISGNIWTVGGGAEGSSLTVAANVLRLRVVDAAFTASFGSASEDFANPYPGSGVFTYVTAIDVPNQRVGVWVNGVRYVDAPITNDQGAGLDSWYFFVFANHFATDASANALNGVLSTSALSGGATKGTLDFYDTLPATM